MVPNGAHGNRVNSGWQVDTLVLQQSLDDSKVTMNSSTLHGVVVVG